MKEVAKNLESPEKNDTKDKKVTAPPKISEKEQKELDKQKEKEQR